MYGKLDASDEEVKNACEMAYVDHFVNTLEDGYDTVLDEETSNISQGQKQLLTIARAFLKDPKILILDEVLSVGDAKFRKKSEKKVMSMFDSGVTVLFVSHSLDQVKRICNKAMILDHGKLIAFGEIDDIASVYEKMIEEREKEVPKKKIKKSTAKKE